MTIILKKILLSYPQITLIIGLFFLSFQSKAQEEFMVYGVIKIQGGSTDSATITVESEKRQFGRIIKLDNSGEYKVWLPYSKDYIIKYSKPGYQTVPIAVSTKLPEGIQKCCFTPFEMSFHLFKPDGSHDSLYKKPIVVVRYETKLKSYFYSLDIDYYIQKMYIKSEADRGKKLKDQAFIAKHKDSLETERKYVSLINSGNVYYSMRQYNMARQMFSKALEIKPKRRYPAYKLEDIETQLVIFNQIKDSLPKNADSIIAAVMNPKVEIKKPIEYKRKTPEELQAIFKKDLYNQIASETKNKKELAERIKFVDNEVINKKDESIKIDTIRAITSKIESTKADTIAHIQAKVEPIKIDTIKPESPKLDSLISNIKTQTDTIKTKPKENIKQEYVQPVQITKPTKTIQKPFNKAAYQDSLRKKYPNERTIEIITEDYKKITRVIINRDSLVTIYLKVEHQWGGIFFFKDNTPFPLENISKSYFEVTTKLLSNKEKNEVKTQHKNTVKTQPKAIQNKTGVKNQKNNISPRK
jgi:tetratricopeptide (TPR) repeat protein